MVRHISYEEALQQMPKGMRNGIEWFNARKGLEIDWPHPSPLASFPYLVTPAKAIYKPAIHMNPKDAAFFNIVLVSFELRMWVVAFKPASATSSC